MRRQYADVIYKLFLFLGLFFLALAALTYLFQGGFLGRLPGDIVIEKENYTVYIPLTTMLVVSVVLSLILNVIKW